MMMVKERKVSRGKYWLPKNSRPGVITGPYHSDVGRRYIFTVKITNGGVKRHSKEKTGWGNSWCDGCGNQVKAGGERREEPETPKTLTKRKQIKKWS